MQLLAYNLQMLFFRNYTYECNMTLASFHYMKFYQTFFFATLKITEYTRNSSFLYITSHINMSTETVQNEVNSVKPRDATGKFVAQLNDEVMTENVDKPKDVNGIAPDTPAFTGDSSMSNMLKHIQTLESKLTERDKELSDTKKKNERITADTRKKMESLLNTVVAQFTKDLDVDDKTCVQQFNNGLEKLVQNGDDMNGYVFCMFD